jgi:tetratricopeptide (TPR) repeat protein
MAEAVEAAERLCELAAGDVEALRTLGGALARVEDYARAALVLEQAREAAPDDVHLLTELGAAYAAAGNSERAQNALRRAVSNDSMAVGARSILAGVLVREGRLDEAESEYRAALRVLPSFGEAAFGLTAILEGRGRKREALHVLIDLLTTDPYAIDALVRLGDMLMKGGHVNEAAQAYRRVLRFQPDNERAAAALTELGSES